MQLWPKMHGEFSFCGCVPVCWGSLTTDSPSPYSWDNYFYAVISSCNDLSSAFFTQGLFRFFFVFFFPLLIIIIYNSSILRMIQLTSSQTSVCSSGQFTNSMDEKTKLAHRLLVMWKFFSTCITFSKFSFLNCIALTDWSFFVTLIHWREEYSRQWW